MVDPRNLEPNERSALLKILDGASFEGANELIVQVDATRVIGGIPTLLDLGVDRSASPARCGDGPVPFRAIVQGSLGEPEGEVLVWVSGGYLSALECAWFTDQTPTEFPAPERIARQTK
jgi:hypothetical protein